jgi:hypothetical protein
MTATERFAERDVVARQYSYADGDVMAFDLGVGVIATADVVDGTLVVVVDDEQYELDLPAGADAQATINNGVVTVEMSGSAGTEMTGGAETAEDTEAER